MMLSKRPVRMIGMDGDWESENSMQSYQMFDSLSQKSGKKKN